MHRWAIKILPVLAAVFRRRKRPVGVSWRMDETYTKVAGEWKYLYRAVDGDGHTVDFLLRAKGDCDAVRCFLERSIDQHGVPEKITIDESGANTAAIKNIQTDSCVHIEERQIKYLNNRRGENLAARPFYAANNLPLATLIRVAVSEP